MRKLVDSARDLGHKLRASSRIIRTCADRSARFFQRGSGRQIGHVQLPAGAVAAVLSNCETVAYIAVANGDVLVVNLSALPPGDFPISHQGMPKLRAPASETPIFPTDLDLSPSSHQIIVGYTDGFVRVFDADTRLIVQVYRRQNGVSLVQGVDYFLPEIDLNNWKVTVPIGNPSEVNPPEILNYANNDNIKDFMYNDSTDGSLVFYTYPCVCTANSCYSRSELREQMVPGSDRTNWTFAQGGRMKGTLKLDAISKDADGKHHRVIIMQIHGRLTNAQRHFIGKCDNNAPPILKIYWCKGLVRVKTKVLKDIRATDPKVILRTDAWGDDAGFNFSEVVGNERFTVEIIASKGRMEIILNGNESVVYDGVHLEKWGIFENYFKAGNYLVSTEVNAFARVKFYDLKVTHQ